MSLFDMEKIQSAQAANLELLQQLNTKLFEGVEQLTALQMSALRAAAEENFEVCRKLLAVRDPQSFAALQTSLTQPMAQAEKLLELNRKVYDLFSTTQAELTKAGETQIAAGTKQVQEALETITSNAPAGAEPAVAVLKSAIESAGSVFESAQKVAKQAAEAAETSINAAAAAATKAATQATAAAAPVRKTTAK
jgi:phasin family protein